MHSNLDQCITEIKHCRENFPELNMNSQEDIIFNYPIQTVLLNSALFFPNDIRYKFVFATECGKKTIHSPLPSIKWSFLHKLINIFLRQNFVSKHQTTILFTTSMKRFQIQWHLSSLFFIRARNFLFYYVTMNMMMKQLK